MFSRSLSKKSEMCTGSFHFPTGEAETLSNAEIGNTERKSHCPGRNELL